MDSLVTLGIIDCFIYSIYNMVLIFKGIKSTLYFESVATIIYFVKLGRFFDHQAKNKSKKAISKLVQITPQYALLKENDQEKEITIANKELPCHFPQWVCEFTLMKLWSVSL